MDYKKIDANDLAFFRSAAGDDSVLVNPESLDKYSRDYTEDLSFPPEAVVLPSSAGQVSLILKYCNDNRIPVTARGAGTGLSGGALPVYGGVSLSSEKLNRIIEIDSVN